MVGGSRDVSVIADPDNNGGVILCIAKQSVGCHIIVAMVTCIITAFP